MPRRTTTKCALEGCPNLIINYGRGRPRRFCTDAHKQKAQRQKQKTKRRNTPSLSLEEIERYAEAVKLHPDLDAMLDNIEDIAGEEAVNIAIRIALLFLVQTTEKG